MLATGGSWSTGTAVPASKIEGASFPRGRRAHFVGSDPASSANHELSGGSWTTRTACGFNATKCAGASVRGNGYVISEANHASYRLDAWTSQPTPPISMNRMTAQSIDDRYFVAAGEPRPYRNLSYIPAVQSFVGIASASSFLHSRSSFAINGAMHSVGGYDGAAGVATHERYSHATDTWTTLTALPAARYRGAGFHAHGAGFYAGGLDSGGTATTTVYRWYGASWSTRAALPAAKSGLQHGGAAV